MSVELVEQYWSVVHKAFVTDRITFTSSVVRADTQEEAQMKFNRLARQRKEYPYCWNEVDLKDITPFTVIV